MRKEHRHAPERGWSLAELLTVTGIIAAMSMVVMPSMLELRRRDALVAAAREVATELRAARAAAISRGRNTAVRFEETEWGWLYAVYEDRDFDGVRTADIRSGVDVRIREPRALLHAAGGAIFGIPPVSLRDPDTGKRIPASASPVRFGNASMSSFSPTGSGTPGSVYVTDGSSRVAMVRVFGATGRVRILMWDPRANAWSEK